MKQLMTRDEALGLKLWQRELVLRERSLFKNAPQPQYCIVWEDPDDLDAPVKITTPSPQWLVMAMHGNVLPPVEDANPPVNKHGNVISGHTLHDNVIDAMTEEDAMVYLLQKDVPMRVWKHSNDNRHRFVICKRSIAPKLTQRKYEHAAA